MTNCQVVSGLIMRHVFHASTAYLNLYFAGCKLDTGLLSVMMLLQDVVGHFQCQTFNKYLQINFTSKMHEFFKIFQVVGLQSPPRACQSRKSPWGASS